MSDSTKPPIHRKPSDAELIEFMDSKTRQSWERGDLTAPQRARIWEGNKRRWRAAQKKTINSDTLASLREFEAKFNRLADSIQEAVADSPEQPRRLNKEQTSTTEPQKKVSWIHRIPVWREFGPWLKWASACFAFALGMTQVNEYGWALAGLIGCGICCLAQIYVWTASPNRFRNRAMKAFLAVLSLGMITVASLTVITIGQDKPWSNLFQKNTERSEMKSAPPPATQLTPAAPSDTRPSTGTTNDQLDIAPEKLLDFYEKYNEAQAEGLVQPYIGKWLEMSGRVTEVRRELAPLREDTRGIKYAINVAIETRRQGSPKSHIVTQAIFEDQRWMDRAVVLKRGENIKVRGMIKSVYSSGFHLEHCEIVE